MRVSVLQSLIASCKLMEFACELKFFSKTQIEATDLYIRTTNLI